MNAQNIALYCFLIFAIIVLLYALIVLWKIFKGEINLNGLLAETVTPTVVATGDGAAPAVAIPPVTKASLSRFQFLIFTFVIAGLFLLLSIEAGTFVDIPTNVLALLGISGGTYAVSKAIPK